MTQSTKSGPTRFGIVGRGWRAEFYQRLASLMPEDLSLIGVLTRGADAARAVEEAWGTRAFTDLGDLLEQDPDFVVVSVPWATTPDFIRRIAGAGVRVLTETPPAPNIEELRRLWTAVGPGGLVQVAEQYPLYPGHAARQEILASGALGSVSSAQVSSTHLYHAIALVRTFLDVGFEDAVVQASEFHGPLVNPQNKLGWTGDSDEHDAVTTLATIEFASGRMGVYDFTTNQWHNPLRSRRIVLRASRGEISDDAVVRWIDPLTVVEAPIIRRQTGWDMNLEGFQLDHLSWEGRVVYRNSFPGLRLSDEDIATANLMLRTAAWARGDGPPPYPLAEGSQDHAIALAMQESARTGQPVAVKGEPWTEE
jgi:predicted dehydrogenase